MMRKNTQPFFSGKVARGESSAGCRLPPITIFGAFFSIFYYRNLVKQPFYKMVNHLSTNQHNINQSAMAALQNVSMKDIYKSLGDLIKMEHSLDPDYTKEMNTLFERTTKKASNITGRYLHKLHEKRTDEKVVKKMITAFPSSLSYQDDEGCLPIHSAIYYDDGVGYIPMLAKEGVKHNVGGDDGRGGLLVDSHIEPTQSFNVLQVIGVLTRGPSFSDARYLHVMKELRESNLLLKKDIRDFDLLRTSHIVESEMIFGYLAGWDPAALKETTNFTNNRNQANFSIFFKAAFKHYPQEMGLLFQKNNEGKMACECAFDKCGKKETFKAIGKIIPFEETTVTVLHYVVEHAPHLLDDFAKYYSSAAHLRDASGRKLYQTKLASGNATFGKSASFFVGLKDDEIAEIDPGTDLYPFMVSASEETNSDLSAVYYLLMRNPALVSTSRRRSSRRSVGNKGGRKRKRG